LDVRQLTERHQSDCDVLRSTISELNQAHDSTQRDTWEQQRLLELREAEYNWRLQEVEQNSRSILEQSQQQCLKLRNELDQALAIHSSREKQHEEHCAKLLADINGLRQAVADLQSRQTESHAQHSAQERLIEQRSALVESLRIENERLSVQYRELATDNNQLCDQWKRSVEQESQAREATSALQEVERALKGQVQSQAEQISNLQEEAENFRVNLQHQSQAHHQCAEELRAELTKSQSLLEMQNQQLSEFRGEVEVLRSSLAEAKNAQELARRDSDENARSAQKFSAQCLLLRDQLQKAAAARRKAESAISRAAELADPNSIAEITQREIETRQTVERLVL
jgi:chromosome segregation ATPase